MPPERPMRSLLTVNGTDAFNAACVAGLGIIQAPRLGLLPLIASDDVVEVLPQYEREPLPLSLVHGYGRNAPRPVRLVMSWIARLLKPHLD